MENTTRRAALGRGLAIAAGAVGFGSATRVAHAGAAGTPRLGNGSTTLTVEGRDVRALVDRAFGEPTRLGDRVTVTADLVATGTDAKIGEFYGTSISTVVPGSVRTPLVSSVENHVFHFADGTLVGSGATLPGVADNVFAVVGGTGRYAGARGTYLARSAAIEHGGDGTASFTFTLTTEARGGI